jgi:hypothetical protein
MVSGTWLGVLRAATLVAGLAPLAVSAAEMRLTVSVPHPDAEGGIARNELRLGALPSATDDFDPALDLEAFLSVGLSAAVRHVEYPPAQQRLWWDMRAPGFPQMWEVEVTSDRLNANITLSGVAPTGVSNGCSGIRWTLRDVQTDQTTEFGPITTVYSYSNVPGVVRRFEVTLAEALATPPAPPSSLWSPRQGRASVYLAWSGSGDPSIRYHVDRETDEGVVRLTGAPIATTSFVDTNVDRTVRVSYRVTAVTSGGCESGSSAPLTLAPNR